MKSMNTPALKSGNPSPLDGHQRRKGGIVVYAAAMLAMVFAFVAFSVDLSYIALDRTQLQAASDASSLAAGLEMFDGLGPTPEPALTVRTRGNDAAVAVAGVHRNGDVASTYVDGLRDVRWGTLTWDTASGDWVETWGAEPHNLVEVTIWRGRPASEWDWWLSTSNNDSQLPLFLAPAIGYDNATLHVRAKAALLPAGGFRVIPGETAPVLPFAMDEDTWDRLIYDNVGGDDYGWDETNGTVNSTPDGILEANLYKDPDTSLPAGNRGTVDFGDHGNSTADLARQILNGLSHDDLSSYENNEFTLDEGPVDVNGDTGWSTSIKKELTDIIGLPRALPIFRQVVNPGNNATYTLVRFVGVRIMEVDLNGAESKRRVIVQPTGLVVPNAIRATTDPMTEIRDDTVFAPLFLYE